MNTPAAPLLSSDSHDRAEAVSAEAGYMLIAVVVMVSLVLIALAVAAPLIAKDLRRDKEVESEHRAQQYVRAIRLYYRKFNSYPPSLDALKQSNNIRFLRQEYVDPLTGKSDWRIIHLGEQKTAIHVFFGQELGGIGAPGSLGSAAGLGSGIGSPIGASGSTGSSGTSSTIGSTSTLASGFSGATVGGSGFGSSGSTGSSTGGGAIVGVGTAKTGASILTPNKQATYETWEFWYDPRIEQLYQKGHMNAGASTGTLGGQPAGSSGASGSTGAFGNGGSFGTGSSFGNGSSFGSGSGSSGFGNSPSTTPTTPTSPTTPQ